MATFILKKALLDRLAVPYRFLELLKDFSGRFGVKNITGR
jgi:hypothetical protein